MKLNRKLSIVAVLFVMMIPGNLVYGAQQQTFPRGPVTMIAPWAAGGVSDAAARAIAESSRRYLGQPIVVQNTVGAGGALAAVQLAQAKPDGYTMMLAAASMIAQPNFEEVAYKPLEDFIPAIQFCSFPSMMVVRTDSPFKNLRDLVDYAKKNPGKITFSTAGHATFAHCLAVQLMIRADIQMTHVPFKSNSEGVTAVLGGHVMVAVATHADAMTHLAEGRVRALGIFMPDRNKVLPDIPTAKEQGYDVVTQGWYGVAVPKGTPGPIVQKLHDAFKEGSADPQFIKIMSNYQLPIVYLNSQDTMKKWRDEYKMYGDIAKVIKK